MVFMQEHKAKVPMNMFLRCYVVAQDGLLECQAADVVKIYEACVPEMCRRRCGQQPLGSHCTVCTFNTDGTSAGVDSSGYRFGTAHKSGIHNGVQKCLNPESDEATAPATQIVNKAVEDARTVGGEYLGTVRWLGAGDRNIPEDFCFGKPSLAPVRHLNACHTPQ